MNSTEGTKNSKKHAREISHLTRRVKKRARQGNALQKARSMAGYKIGTANDTEDEEDEEN